MQYAQAAISYTMNRRFAQRTDLSVNHVEFPNHPRRNLRKPCGTEVTDRVPTTTGFIIKLKMVYPLPSLKAQIIAMYQRPGFETLWKNGQIGMGKQAYIPIFMMEKYGKLFHLVQIIQ